MLFIFMQAETLAVECVEAENPARARNILDKRLLHRSEKDTPVIIDWYLCAICGKTRRARADLEFTLLVSARLGCFKKYE